MCTLPPSYLSKSACKPAAACFAISDTMRAVTQGHMQRFSMCCLWTRTSRVVVSHPLRMRKALGSIPSVSMHSTLHVMLHVSWLEKDFCRPPAPSTDSVSAVLFVGLVSCLSVPLSAKGHGGQYTLENAGRDDLGGFSTPILLRCSCSKKCSKSSRPHFLSVGLVQKKKSEKGGHCWDVYLASFLAEQVSLQTSSSMLCYFWHYESSDSGAHGVVVSHPLRMRKALGSIPSVSMHSMLHVMLHVSWLEKDFCRPPAPSTDSVSAVLFVSLVLGRKFGAVRYRCLQRAREGNILWKMRGGMI